MNVQIKSLVWEWEDFRSVWKAASVVGEYTVWTIQNYTCFKRPEWSAGKGCGTKDGDGFAAAQADFEQRIRSTLSPSPSIRAEPVAWREAYERLMNWLLRYPKFTLGDLGQLERDLGPFVRELGHSPTVAVPSSAALSTSPATEQQEVSEAIPSDIRGFVYAIMGADTWLEAGSIWEQNPDQRKAAHALLGEGRP